MLSDLRYALRSYIRTPGFSFVAVLTLALGIGGATAIFSVVDGVLLRPLPYPEAERIVQVTRTTVHRDDGAFSPADFLDLKRDATRLTSLAGYREDIIDLTGTGEPERVRGVQTTASFFEVFGVAPLAGRVYREATDQPGAAVAVIGEGLWRRSFGARPDIVGTSMRINGQPTEIVGILPGSFAHPLKSDIWTLSPLPVPVSPVPMDDGLATREVQYFGAVARLASGAMLADASQEAERIGVRLAKEFPETNKGEGFRVAPLGAALVADVRTALLVLLGSVACVLLIACANVAGLLLARGMARRRELAVRSSLGAGTMRLVRQLLTESLLLALVGGVAGLLVAAWGVELLLAMAPDTIPRLDEVRLDWRVGTTAFVVTTLVGVLFGLAPAFQASRLTLVEDLKDGGRTGTSARTTLRSALVVGQVAAALVLLISAGLMLSSLMRLRAVDPGFRTSSLVAVNIPLPQARYAEAAQRQFYTDLLARVHAQPAMAQAAIAFPFPLTGSNASASIEIEGQPVQAEKLAELNAASGEYFQTFGLRLIRGRTLETSDGAEATPVAVINERLAREWGNRDPIGKRIKIGDWVTVVGIVSDMRRQSLDAAPKPALYLSYQQFTLPFLGVMVRTDQSASTVGTAVRAAVKAIDPELPLGDVETIEQMVQSSTGQPRFRTLLVLAFAGVALLLAAVGVYGLMSFAVTQRTAEMGVRLALGARPSQVCRLVMQQGLGLAAAGVVTGVVVALAATRAMAGLLFETSTTDPTVFGGVAAMLLTIAAVACYLPARRAMRVDPMRALRAE